MPSEPAVMEALRRIRDHGETHDEPCHAITNGDCAELMQEYARSALSRPYSDEDVERVARALFGASGTPSWKAKVWAAKAIRAFLGLEGEAGERG